MTLLPLPRFGHGNGRRTLAGVVVRIRILAGLSFLILLGAAVEAKLAFADHFGAWPFPDPPALYPPNCLDAGTMLYIESSPDKHEVSASNSCLTNQSVKVIVQHFDSGGRLIDSCTNGFSTNYAQCSDQSTSLSGDYWAWTVYLNPTIQYGFSCSNQGGSYTLCWE